MLVRCKNCGGKYWETTDTYDPNEIPDGSMLRLRQPWLGNRWPIFGDGILPKADGSGLVSIKPSEMDCPGCLASIIYNGQLVVELDNSDVPVDKVSADDVIKVLQEIETEDIIEDIPVISSKSITSRAKLKKDK